jgi:hypothetical protein
MVRRGMEITWNIIKLTWISLNQNQTSPLGLGATLALTSKMSKVRLGLEFGWF